MNLFLVIVFHLDVAGVGIATVISQLVSCIPVSYTHLFFYAVSYSAMMNIHLKILDGINDHHKAEALFKAFGKALDMATMEEPRIKEAWTTKGSL